MTDMPDVPKVAQEIRDIIETAHSPALTAQADQYKEAASALVVKLLSNWFEAEQAGEMGNDDKRLLRHAYIAQTLAQTDQITMNYVCIDLMKLIGDELLARFDGSWVKAYAAAVAGEQIWGSACSDPDCAETHVQRDFNKIVKGDS